MSIATRQLYLLAKNALIDASGIYTVTRAARGEDHPATRAALGRYLYYRGWVPQRGLASPEAVAWHRESGADSHLPSGPRVRRMEPTDETADERQGSDSRRGR